MTSPPPLAGRTALVTGAGSGIGRGIATAFAEAGAAVVIAARREKTGSETARLINGDGGRAVCVECDVTAQDRVEAAVGAAVESFGGLDIVVHNAVSRRTPEGREIADLDPEVWDHQAAVSLRGAYYLALAAHQLLVDSGRGRFMFITSAAAMEGSGNVPAYAAMKAAQRGLAKTLAREWGRDCITVNCIAPLARTGALDNALRANPDLNDRLVRRIPIGRFGDPKRDVGAAAVFLAGDGAGYITGQTLAVDGGSYTGP